MLAAIAFSIFGCGSSATPATPKPPDGAGVMKPEVRYYKGTSSVTSPDDARAVDRGRVREREKAFARDAGTSTSVKQGAIT